MATDPATSDSFYWEGINKAGQIVNGEMEAANQTIVKVELRRQGIVLKKISKKRHAFWKIKGRRITPANITIFTRQLATMLAAGIPLVQSLEIIIRSQHQPKLKDIVTQIKNDIEAGSTITQALRRHPRYFNELFCSLIDAGEQSGSLDIMLEKIASYKERIESIKGKIKKALFYPAAVLVVAVLVTATLLLFVVPQFETLFKNFGAELPTMTQLVINLSMLLQHYWWTVLILFLALIVGIAYLHRHSPQFTFMVDRLSLKVPIIGPILKKAAVARFARTLSVTFAAGLPLVEALQVVSSATGNRLFSLATLQVRDNVSTGQPMQAAMRKSDLFPDMVVQMIGIGEESGSLEQMLTKVATIYEQEVDDAVDGLSALLEPIIMVILGVIVGGLVIAMYLPIFKLGSVI